MVLPPLRRTAVKHKINPMKIYTKVGDKGRTRLADGRAAVKCHPRLEALGDLDELSAVLGWAITLDDASSEQDILENTQKDLFELGAALAGGKRGQAFWKEVAQDTARLERIIDAWIKDLPPLKNFVLPGGSPAGAALHMARTVCRRAERAAAALSLEEPLPHEALAYLNRLSDFLFVMARRVNEREYRPEPPWKPLT